MKLLIDLIRNTHFTAKLFAVLGGIALIMAAGFLWPILLNIAIWLLILTGVAALMDIFLLFNTKHKIEVDRSMSKVLSLSDENEVKLSITNHFPITLELEIREDLPEQLQALDFVLNTKLTSGQSELLRYKIRPTVRGEYTFGHCNVMASTAIGLVRRRHRLLEQFAIPVYPSIIQMRHYDLMAFSQVSTLEGIKKIRRLGHSYEFDRIKTYVQGDDIRSINWKATGRKRSLMVNQYEDERAQQIYCVIDKGRSMRMPFNELSLFDYAVNTSLVISNIAIKKYDKAGLITFSDKLGSTIRADRSKFQVKKILHALYNEAERTQESNYDLLYRAIKNMVQQRSLILLFMNTESDYALERILPILRKISKMHLLVAVVFENNELKEYASQPVNRVRDIYSQTIAQKLGQDKRNMVRKLRKMGIQTIHTTPEDLSMNTVNKYLELKGRGLI